MRLLCGNNLEVLPALPDASIDSVVTDPPYGLSFMGKSWDYDVPGVELWRQVIRVLKPGGHLLSFFGTRTYHRGVIQIEDAGFEIRDQIGWAYGSGFPKSHNLDGAHKGWGTALKPAWEPICVARKPLAGTVAENVMEHGTGALNIDGCRVGSIDGTGTARKPALVKDTAAGFGKGEYMGGKGSSLGRWPANVLHDGSPEVLAAFPDAPGQMASSRADGSAMGNKIYGAMNHGIVPMEPRKDLTSSAARFFYCAKTSRADREEGLDGFATGQSRGGGGIRRILSGTGRRGPCLRFSKSTSKKLSSHRKTYQPRALPVPACNASGRGGAGSFYGFWVHRQGGGPGGVRFRGDRNGR